MVDAAIVSMQTPRVFIPSQHPIKRAALAAKAYAETIFHVRNGQSRQNLASLWLVVTLLFMVGKKSIPE